MYIFVTNIFLYISEKNDYIFKNKLKRIYFQKMNKLFCFYNRNKLIKRNIFTNNAINRYNDLINNKFIEKYYLFSKISIFCL